MASRYSLGYLLSLPTLESGHFDNLKIDTGVERVWLSRMTKEDGAAYDNGVTVERMNNGVWEAVEEYPALVKLALVPAASAANPTHEGGPFYPHATSIAGQGVTIQRGHWQPGKGGMFSHDTVRVGGKKLDGYIQALRKDGRNYVTTHHGSRGILGADPLWLLQQQSSKQNPWWKPSKKNPSSEDIAEEYAKKAAGNWKKFESFAWRGADRVESPEDWALVYTSSRDSGLLEKSNAAAIEKMLKPFSEGDDPDVRFQGASHWGVGHVDGFAIRVYRDGEITDAFRELAEANAALENCPVLDESDYSEREYDATLRNISSAGWKFLKKGVPEDWAGSVFSWFWDHDQEAVENRDDSGGYPSDDKLKEAMLAFGWVDLDEDEDLELDVATKGPWEGERLVGAAGERSRVKMAQGYHGGRWQAEDLEGRTWWVEPDEGHTTWTATALVAHE
jgi:hypothetical protein